MMTYHEAYGALPMRLLRTLLAANVSPADYDQILAVFGKSWADDTTIPWEDVSAFVNANIVDGTFRMSRYM